jgi:hypothetical protein
MTVFSPGELSIARIFIAVGVSFYPYGYVQSYNDNQYDCVLPPSHPEDTQSAMLLADWFLYGLLKLSFEGDLSP